MGLTDTLKNYGGAIQAGLQGLGGEDSFAPGFLRGFATLGGSVVQAYNEGQAAQSAERERMAALIANAEAGIRQPYPGQPTINVLPAGGPTGAERSGAMPGYVVPLAIGAALLLLVVAMKR